jgi:peptidoglycan-associated lipoprotein
MRRTNWTYVGLACLMALLIFFPSCAKKQLSSESSTGVSAEEEARRRAEEEARRRQQGAIQEESLGEATLQAMRTPEAKEEFVNDDIHFDFDSSALTPEAQDILKKKALWLKANPGVTVIIEGHCDDRGTNEYNMALGDRRADSAKSFLLALGIDKSRLTTVSWGEEKPLVRGTTEEARAKNRRDHFAIEK